MQHFDSICFVNETDSEMYFLSSFRPTDTYFISRQTIFESQGAKPLPPLPRGWPRVRDEVGLFLRTIGLGIVVTAFHGYFSKNFQEPEKVAIRRSRVTALLRALIHVVPLGISIFEIVLNLRGYYVGKQFDKQNYLQFAAKAHEIAIQASIATILLSYIRFHISTDKGMPFGAVLGGLQFLQVSYLWSSELWSSIVSKDFQRRKKICFVSLIFVCTIIAATAGPSSANLLIARQALWSTGSNYLAINATFQDIWPDRLDVEQIDRACAVINFESLHYDARCPLSEIYDVLNTYGEQSTIDYEVDSPSTTWVSNPKTVFSRVVALSPCYTFQNRSCATSPQTAVVNGFGPESFNQASRSDKFSQSNRLDNYQILWKNYYQPYTTTSCVLDVVSNSSDETLLRFPRILETISDLEKDREIVSIPGSTKGQMINNLSGDNSSFRVHWIDLPQSIFGTGIPGAVIVNPQSPNGPPYKIYQCTSDAGWGSSAIETDTLQYGQAVTSYRMNSSPKDANIGVGVYDVYGFTYSSIPDFANISSLPFPERRISVSKDWMQFLNPTVVLPDNSTTAFISQYLSLATRQLEEGHVARTLADFLCVALSNTNVEAPWQGTYEHVFELLIISGTNFCPVFNDTNTLHAACDTCLVLEIENSVYGWLYTASETTTILAITVMLAYCLLVLGHIIYYTIFGVSSSAWDSIAELVALAMNSSPTKTLQNTCAGIIGLKALKSPVRVLVTSPGHLELVFGEVKDPDAQASTLEMNQRYGKLVCEDENKYEELEPTGRGKLQKRAVVGRKRSRRQTRYNTPHHEVAFCQISLIGY